MVTVRLASKTVNWWCCSVTTPGETRMSGGGVTYYLEQARQKSNARMIIIDPRYTDTGAGREDEWIPIRPGTDAALVNALAYVLITEEYGRSAVPR